MKRFNTLMLVTTAAAIGSGATFYGCTVGAKPAATPVAATFPGSASIDKARAAAVAGKLDGAADALSDALREIDDAGPLRIRHLQLVDKDVGGYGIYTPLAQNVLKPGDGLFLYFEPAGMTHQFSENLWHSDLSADLAILLPDGTVAQDQPDFLVSKVNSHEPNREIQFEMRLATRGISEGDYQLRVTLHDRLGKKTAVEQLPVTFKIK